MGVKVASGPDFLICLARVLHNISFWLVAVGSLVAEKVDSALVYQLLSLVNDKIPG